MDRRAFLGLLLAAGVMPWRSLRATLSADGQLFSAQGDADGRYSLASFSAMANDYLAIDSNFRGHGLAVHPVRGDIVMFARRPGTQGMVIDREHAAVIQRFEAAPGRVMAGHGVFAVDGSVLYSVECDVGNGAGQLVVRDTDDYRVLDAITTHGIGPHEVKRLPGSELLVVANGGIHTSTDATRRELNLDTMRSSLVYLDPRRGERVDEVVLDEPKASIRHLDIASDGSVVFATQLQRAATGHQRSVALAAVHRRGGAVQALGAPDAVLARLNDYLGSVVIDDASRLAGCTSPRGNLAVFWHIDDGKLAGYHALSDVCGITLTGTGAARCFVLSNSAGELRWLRTTDLAEDRQRRVRLDGVRWDNHLYALAG